jgi:hypothetical protein
MSKKKWYKTEKLLNELVELMTVVDEKIEHIFREELESDPKDDGHCCNTNCTDTTYEFTKPIIYKFGDTFWLDEPDISGGRYFALLPVADMKFNLIDLDAPIHWFCEAIDYPEGGITKEYLDSHLGGDKYRFHHEA